MVKPGYKQTEIGVIPENWEVGAIGSVCTSVDVGGNYQNSATPSDYPLIKMGNLSRGNITLEKVEYIKATIPDQKDLLHYGDVLFNTRNTPELVGKVAIWRNELPRAYYNSNMLRFVFDTEKADSFYMNLALNTEKTISAFRNIAKGTTSVAAIYPQDLLKVIIPIPPLAEQQRIAETLSDMDELIASLEKLIEKKKAIKQGAMQELLTGKRHLPGFTGEWREYAVEDIAVFCTASIPTSWINLRQYIGTDNMLANRDGIRDNTIAIPYVVVREYREGDILLSNIRPYLKKIWLADKAGGCSNDVFVIRSINNEKVLPTFLFYLLSQDAFFDEVMASSVGTKMPRGDKNIIKNYRITVPSDSSEQQSIVSILSSMDYEMKKLKEKLEKTRQIKQGMMQQLLTGKIRV